MGDEIWGQGYIYFDFTLDLESNFLDKTLKAYRIYIAKSFFKFFVTLSGFYAPKVKILLL